MSTVKKLFAELRHTVPRFIGIQSNGRIGAGMPLPHPPQSPRKQGEEL